MAEHITARVTLQAASNITADNASNSFTFYTTNLVPGNYENVLDMIEDLYTVQVSGSSYALGAYINATMKRQAIIKLYRNDDPEPRAPFEERVITLPNPGAGNPLPGEVALCVSFQGTRVAGLPQSRRRGRVFLGPLQSPTGSQVIPPAQMIGDVVRSFQKLKDEADASLIWQWRIWSPTNNNSVLIDNGWVDNAWDTQRRRGVEATARTIFD